MQFPKLLTRLANVFLRIPINVAAIKAASFLATRSGGLTVASEQAIVWDVVVYDDAGNYDNILSFSTNLY